MNPQLNRPIRMNLESLRDDLKLLCGRHPPLYHYRFRSGSAMTTRGWQLFLEEFFCGSDDYFSYIQDEAAFAGLFTLVDNFGTPCDKKGGPPPNIDRFPHPGMRPFVDVVSDVMQLLRRGNGRGNALAEWMGIVHDLAELNATPRLQGATDIWVGSEEIRLTALLRGDDVDGRPNPAIIGHLNRDVFTSSATAIDLLLDPQSHFVWRLFERELMPPSLREVFELLPAIAGAEEHTTTPTAPSVAANKPPDFMFAKTPGDIWKLRFRYGHNEEECESGEFVHILGFEYYQRLLQSGSNGLKALDISPPGPSSASDLQPSSAIDEDEWLDSQSDDDAHAPNSGMYSRLSRGELADLANEVEALESELTSDSVKADRELKKELTRHLREARRKLKTAFVQNPDAKPIFAAINRVKGNLRRVIVALDKEDGMPRLAKYLKDQIKRSGDGWRYENNPPVQWGFTVPPNM